MKINPKRFSQLIKGLGLEYEIDRLKYAGLMETKIAEVLYDLFNPSLSSGEFKKSRLFTTMHNSQRNFNIVMDYYSLGCGQKLTLEETGKKYALSHQGVRIYIERFRKNIFHRDPFKAIPYHMSREATVKIEEVKIRNMGRFKKEFYYKCLDALTLINES